MRFRLKPVDKLQTTFYVPEPPPLDLSPTSDRAVVTVAVGKDGRDLLAITRDHMKAYARRLEADFVVLDWPGNPLHPLTSKFAIYRTLEHYQRIAYIDADVLLRNGCVNVFDACQPNELGFVDELPHHKQQPKFQCEKTLVEFRKRHGFKPIAKLPWFLNSGVMVIPRSAADLFKPPTFPLTAGHTAEQDTINARVLDSGHPYRLLDRRCNWQYWTSNLLDDAPDDAILHWSGASQDTRLGQLREWARRFPLVPYPAYDPGDPIHAEWAIDKRHAQWLNEVLMSGKFDNVLEIGCYQGFSTRAILAAAKAKLVDYVTLCDVAIRPELRAVLAEYDLGDRVTVAETGSRHVLKKAAAFDLVFVDGDHSRRAVERETRLLLDAKVPVIFAHDTSDASRIHQNDGPQWLKRELLLAGYLVIEDNAFRGWTERTERGMMFAARDRKLYQIGLDAYRKTCPC
jgi:hypothetical protein